MFINWWVCAAAVAQQQIINPLSPNIHIQILQTDLYMFP